MKIGLFIVLAVALGCAATSESDASGSLQADAALKPAVVINGAQSQIKKKAYLRITGKKDWVLTWQMHKGQSTAEAFDHYYNPLGMPEIDFERYMVVAIFEGECWNNAGIDAVEVVDRPDAPVLRYADKSFQTAGPAPGGGAKKGAAFGFFVLPRSEKALFIEEDVRGMRDTSPKWKRLAELGKL